MVEKSVTPSTDSKSFTCPHCGAHAQQAWSNLYASTIVDGVPYKSPKDTAALLATVLQKTPEGSLARYSASFNSEQPFFLNMALDRTIRALRVGNLHLSQCHVCKGIAVWVANGIVHPPVRLGPQPNPDLPPDILRDFEEARSIVSLSPRAAAAMLRLAIQKLCAHLGGSGRDINSDIASLVQKGLDSRVQRALDIVRVIGNESVHPGELDMRDDRDTAIKLFGLVNLIAEKMISEPKHVEALYETLPEAKRLAIEKRDERDD